MGWLGQVGQLLQKYAGGQSANEASTHQDFDQVAQAAPKDVLSSGIAEAFRSNQTPAFPQMVAQLFSHSNGEQRAGILSHLLGGAGPGMLSQVLGGGVLGSLLSHGGGQQITPEMAQNISPEEVQKVAAHAEQANPSIVNTVSDFYAQHPMLVKTLGAAALSIAMSKMSRR
jgi:hypothetical protein